jgi:hypothetical protein
LELTSNWFSDKPTKAPESPLASGEQNTPLTSNISDKSKQVSTPQQQNQVSSLNLEVKSSPKLLISESVIPKETASKLLPEQASPKLDPVNLEDNFAAANEVDPGHYQKSDSPCSSGNKEVTVYEKPMGWYPPPNIRILKYFFRGLESQATCISSTGQICWQG